MKRSTASWTTAIAAAALLTMPAASWAQQTTPAQPSPSTSRPAGADVQTPSSPSPPGAATSPQQPDTGTVRKHLTAARDTLSQLTQLPAAAQLTGDARTQVSQLITNFNELITTNTEWRASYTKVVANLNALIGDQKTDESPATPVAGQAGAVGTSGTVTLDPAIRAKLVEFRAQLMEFEKAASGASSSAATPTPSTEASLAAQPAEPAASPAAAPSAPPAAAANAPASPPSAEPTPTPTSTAGSSATPAATGGTSGRNPAPRSAEPEAPQSSAAQQGSQHQAARHAELMRHIDAIEAILNGTSPAGTTGSTAKPGATTGAPSSLNRAQIDQIRTHLTELRRAIEQAGK